MKWIVSIAICIIIGTTQQAMAGSITLTWSKPTLYSDGAPISAGTITGYNVYYGTTTQSYGAPIFVAGENTLTYTIQNLGIGTYYSAVAAVNVNGMVGALSEEVVDIVPTINGIASVIRTGPTPTAIAWDAPTTYVDGSDILSSETLSFTIGCGTARDAYTIITSAGTGTAGYSYSLPISTAIPPASANGLYYCAAYAELVSDPTQTSAWSNEAGVVKQSAYYSAPLVIRVSPGMTGVQALAALHAPVGHGNGSASPSGRAMSQGLGAVVARGNGSAALSGLAGAAAQGAISGRGNSTRTASGIPALINVGALTASAPAVIALAGIHNLAQTGMVGINSSMQYEVLEVTNITRSNVQLFGLDGKQCLPTKIHVTQ